MDAYRRNYRDAAPARNWGLGWLAYALLAFAVGLSLSYCALHVIETAAKIAV